MSKRVIDVELTCWVTVEIDDEVTSEFYDGETVMTAHENRERFVEGATFADVVHSLAVHLGLDNRRLSNCDGWADFPDEAARALTPWPETSLSDWHERPPTPRPTGGETTDDESSDERGSGR